MPAKFRLGDVVCVRVDTTRQGPVIEVQAAANDRHRYRVFHSATEIREYYEEQLVSVESIEPETGVTLQSSLDADTFRAKLTAARLSHPLVDSLYALHAARIRYVPFQLKPLLRFLRADRPRILIADEVGVGKTIEAGLILRELQSRQRVDNVLIVCPKALVSKWHSEMRRFDEEFRVLNSDLLRYCLRETSLDGVWPQQYSRAIVHLELLRGEEYLDGREGRRATIGLRALNPSPEFSVMIVDEAHHLRNPGTRSYELAEFLCDVSDAVIFLSATPVHLGSRNLFSLLRLLRPDLFLDEAVFDTMIEPNQHLTTAMRHIRHRSPADSWPAAARAALEEAAATEWGRHVLGEDSRFTTWATRMREALPLSNEERVSCLRDLEEVHTLAHVMNRTRRRDIGRFTVREPHKVEVPFTDAQFALYEALLEFRRELLLTSYDPAIVRMIMDTLERQASSSLPALVPMLDRFLESHAIDAAELTDVDEADLTSVDDIPIRDSQRLSNVRELAASLPPDDPKRDRLEEIVQDTLAGDGPGKLLVFSYFLHTLDYLHDHLSLANYRVALVTGKISDEDRERIRDRFRLDRNDPDAIDILLSSEVGCEGLDYEFCDRLVNYDIPWNPMRIEQRIGRIDRFGQASDKVLIFNFVTPGTVEERIFHRCWDRIGIFQNTVGDLEEILGETVHELTQTVLNPRLSIEQAEQIALQHADNVLRLVEEQRRLEDEGMGLLGLEESFTSDVEQLVAEGRFVSHDELLQMISQFVRLPEHGGAISADARDPGLYRLRLNRDGRTAIASSIRRAGFTGRPATQFLRWLDDDSPHLLVTFDQAYAAEHRDVPFITAVHPLARLATQHWYADREPFFAHLELDTPELPQGRYAFACHLWETLAMQPEVRLVPVVWDLDQWRSAPEVAGQLVALVGRATYPPASPQLDSDHLTLAQLELEEEVDRQRRIALDALQERNGGLVARRLASVTAHYHNRLQRIPSDESIATHERIARMRHAERDRIERDYQSQREEIERRRDADIVSQRIAAGTLVVQARSNDDK